MAPFSDASSGTARAAFSNTCHSTASTWTSTPQACLRFSCSASFIGSGSIWPEPDVEIMLKELEEKATRLASAAKAAKAPGASEREISDCKMIEQEYM